jgi:hypothetical protein
MKRNHLAGALAVMAGLLHWSCCGCEDQPTAPVVVVTPTPAPTATPSTCTIRPTVPDVFRCAAEPPPRFQAIVVAAQDQVRREHPELFDGSGRVHDQRQYTGQLGQTLRANGHCADGGVDDEISVKPTGSGSQEFSELYDVVTGDRQVWNNYVFTCRPSLF